MGTLRHIVKIEEADCKDVSKYYAVAGHSVVVTESANFKEINTVGLIEVTEESNFEENERIWTVTIKYTSPCKTPEGTRRKVYQLTDAVGQRYLVGSASRPYPVVKESNPYPSKANGQILRDVTITYKSKEGMRKIL